MPHVATGGTAEPRGSLTATKLPTQEHRDRLHQLADSITLADLRTWISVRMDDGKPARVTVNAATAGDSVNTTLEVAVPRELKQALAMTLKEHHDEVERALKLALATTLTAGGGA